MSALRIVALLSFSSYALSQSTRLPVATSLDERLGWVSTPNSRGTLDIIYNCASTAVLCSWSILNLNVPASEETKWAFIRRKLWLTALCFLGPEFIVMISSTQWSLARSSWCDWQEAGQTYWTMCHSFFADMGGLLLVTPDFPPFPIDSKQLLCLVQCKVVDPPKLLKKQIQDRNKADELLRAITLLQTGWFVINIVGRSANHLAITTLELTTAAFLVCNIATVYFWFYKPADIMTSELIKTTLPIEEVVIRAEKWMERRDTILDHGLPKKITKRHGCYERTPLEFISRKEWDWSLCWGNWIHILRNFRVPMINFVPTTLPVSRFGNSRVPHGPPSPLYYFLLLLCSVYSAIFITGWNFQFPTPIEQLLWRISSIALMAIVFGYWFFSALGFTLYPAIRQKLIDMVRGQESERHDGGQTKRRQWVGAHSKFRQKCHNIAQAFRNNSISKDPLLTIPLKTILPVHILGFFYCLCRTYIILSDILELRSLPPSAFDNVKWSNLLPHF